MMTKTRKRYRFVVDVAVELLNPDLERLKGIKKSVQVAMAKRGNTISMTDSTLQIDFTFHKRSDQLVSVHQLIQLIGGMNKQRDVSFSFAVNDNLVNLDP